MNPSETLFLLLQTKAPTVFSRRLTFFNGILPLFFCCRSHSRIIGFALRNKEQQDQNQRDIDNRCADACLQTERAAADLRHRRRNDERRIFFCQRILEDHRHVFGVKVAVDGRVVFVRFVDFDADEVFADGADGVADLAGDAVSQVPDYALRWAGKAAETATQGYMVYRLGKAAVRVLHPVRVPQDESRLADFVAKILRKKN